MPHKEKLHTLEKELKTYTIPSDLRIHERGGRVDLTPLDSYAIDYWRTWRREDAIAYAQEKEGHRVWISTLNIAPYLLKTARGVRLNELARTNSFNHGLNEALTVECSLQEGVVSAVAIYRSVINCVPYVHQVTGAERLYLEAHAAEYGCDFEDLLASPELPWQVNSGLRAALGGRTSHAAVCKAMHLQNRLVGMYLAHLQLAAPYTVVQPDGSLRYNELPIDKPHVAFTNPLRRLTDSLTHWQVHNRLSREKNFLTRSQVSSQLQEQLCYAA